MDIIGAILGIIGLFSSLVAWGKLRAERDNKQVDIWKVTQETMLKNFVDLKAKDIERERRISELRDMIEALRGELSEARHSNAVLQIKYDDLKADLETEKLSGAEKDKRLAVMAEELASLYEQISHSRSLSHIRRQKP